MPRSARHGVLCRRRGSDRLTQTLQPRPTGRTPVVQIPAPIPDRINEVGGIESMTVDGRRWYFGFAYSMDLVISPLIDDPGVMAAFASKYMMQGDGAHDAAYWRELVELSVGESDLVAEDADRDFDSATLAADRFTLGYHLRYLLGAATGFAGDGFFDDPAVYSAIRTAGPDDPDLGFDDIDTCKAALRDPDKAAAATVVMNRYLEFVLGRMPANWPQVFWALRP